MSDTPDHTFDNHTPLLLAIRRKDWETAFERMSADDPDNRFLQHLFPEDQKALLVEAAKRSRVDIVDMIPVESLYINPHVIIDVIRFAHAAKDGTSDDSRFLLCLKKLVLSTRLEKSAISLLLDETLPTGRFSTAQAILDCLREEKGEKALAETLQGCLLDFTRHDWPEALDGALKIGAPLDNGDHALYYTAFNGVRDPAVQEMILKWYARDEKLLEDNNDRVVREIRGTHEKLRQKSGGEKSPLIRACSNDRDFRQLLLDKGDMTPEDFVRDKDIFGNSVLDLLGARKRLDLVFDPAFWRGRTDEMMRLWRNHVSPVYQKDFDIAQVADMIAERERHASFKKRVKKDAGKFSLK